MGVSNLFDDELSSSAAVTSNVLDGRYQLRREIARGRHGAVYEAEHLVTHMRVAIKTLSGPKGASASVAHARLVREGRILAAIKHANVVAVLDAGVCTAHGPYLVLEMIEGRPLDGILLTRHTLPVEQAVALAVQICDALRSVHRHGVLHRDVKPSNVLIARGHKRDRVELIDFGVATVGHEGEAPSEKLTKVGELLGAVEYTAPEQLMGKSPLDARVDVYGVGVIVYECLTGEVPYAGTPTAVITSMLTNARPLGIRARREDVSVEIEAAVLKALEIEPSKRHASAADLARALIAAVGGTLATIDLLDVRDDHAETPPVRVAPTPVRAAPTPARAAPAPVRTAAAMAAVAALRRPASATSASTTTTTTTSAQSDVLRRRQFARAPYVAPVRVQPAQGESYDGHTEDLSEGGVLMVSETGGADAERVTLRIPLPVSGRVVKLEAISKWVKTRRSQRAIGVEFINPPEEARKEIRAYVALMTGAPAAPRV